MKKNVLFHLNNKIMNKFTEAENIGRNNFKS